MCFPSTALGAQVEDCSRNSSQSSSRIMMGMSSLGAEDEAVGGDAEGGEGTSDAGVFVPPGGVTTATTCCCCCAEAVDDAPALAGWFVSATSISCVVSSILAPLSCSM